MSTKVETNHSTEFATICANVGGTRSSWLVAGRWSTTAKEKKVEDAQTVEGRSERRVRLVTKLCQSNQPLNLT